MRSARSRRRAGGQVAGRAAKSHHPIRVTAERLRLGKISLDCHAHRPDEERRTSGVRAGRSGSRPSREIGPGDCGQRDRRGRPSPARRLLPTAHPGRCAERRFCSIGLVACTGGRPVKRPSTSPSWRLRSTGSRHPRQRTWHRCGLRMRSRKVRRHGQRSRSSVPRLLTSSVELSGTTRARVTMRSSAPGGSRTAGLAPR